MIESSPAILGYAFENIDRRLMLFGHLVKIYNLPINPVAEMESDFFLFSTKIDKLMVVARVMRDYEAEKETSATFRRLIKLNIENLLVALKDKETGEPIKNLFKRAKAVKKADLSREEKREIIAKELAEINEDDAKILRRYLKGYPK